jgi:hypothetical protein
MNIAHLSMAAAPKGIGSVGETEIRASGPDRRHSHGNSVLYIEHLRKWGQSAVMSMRKGA